MDIYIYIAIIVALMIIQINNELLSGIFVFVFSNPYFSISLRLIVLLIEQFHDPGLALEEWKLYIYIAQTIMFKFYIVNTV